MSITETVLAGQPRLDTQVTTAGEGPKLRTDQTLSGDHLFPVSAAHTPEPTSGRTETYHAPSVRALTSPAAEVATVPVMPVPPGISSSAIDHVSIETQLYRADGALARPPEPAIADPALNGVAPVLVDDTLAVLANQVGDLETFRMACASQLGALTRVDADKDGKHRGWGLPIDHPAAVQQSAIVASIEMLEEQSIKALEKHLKRSPLGPWVLGQKGIGFKTMARLLAATGDPYWNSLHDRPRLVSELWSYCGYGDPAQTKTKGQRVGWSPEAKMRAFLCIDPTTRMLRKPCYSIEDEAGHKVGAVHADECTCSPWRVLYDEEKARYVGSVHDRECSRCTAKGQPPAPIGSPRKAAHVNQIAIRNTTKKLLKALWLEAKRLHELPDGQKPGDNQSGGAVGAPTLSSGQLARDNHSASAAGEPNVDEASAC